MSPPTQSHEASQKEDPEKSDEDLVRRGQGGVPDEQNREERRWNEDATGAVQQIRRSLAESTAACSDLVLANDTKVCATTPSGYASFNESRGLWEVMYRPLRSRSGPSTSALKPVADLTTTRCAEADRPSFPPVDLVRSVLKRVELSDLINLCRGSQQSSSDGVLQECLPIQLRQGQMVNLSPIFESIHGHGVDFLSATVSAALDFTKLCAHLEWKIALGDPQQSESRLREHLDPDLSKVQDFVEDCLLSVSDELGSENDTDENAASVVSVDTPHQTPGKQSDVFVSVSSLGDLSLHTTDTAIATDEDSRLTDDGPKSLPKESKLEREEPPKKRSKMSKGGVARDLEQIRKDEGRVAPPERKIVQLFASEFSADNIDLNSHGRSKRKIKQVVRFNAAPHSYPLEKKKRAASGKTGSGFLCPQCSFHCSYDARQCPACRLPCRYVAGTGVVVERERDEVAKEVPSSIKGELIFCEEDGKKKPPEQNSNGQNKGNSSTDTEKTRKTQPVEPETSIQSSMCTSPTSGIPPTANERPTAIESERKDENAGEILECAVCDKCLNIFPASYLQTHRKRTHKLPSNVFGCPYCKTRLSSVERRKIHIQNMHPGKPPTLSAEEFASIKLLPYICPFPSCNAPPFSLGGLRNHVRYHDVEWRDVQHQVCCICPFCPLDGNNGNPIFETAESLEAHVEKEHEGCSLIGQRLPPSLPPPSKKGKKKPLKIASSSSDLTEALHEALHGTPLQETEKWKPLSYDQVLTEIRDSDKDLGRGEMAAESVVDGVEAKLRAAQQRMAASQKSGKDDMDGKEYAAENRLYQRGLRERVGKADSERLEKERYKEKVEQRLLVWKYENRGRPKKTKAELEEEALLTRPIRFEERKGHCVFGDKCFVGDDCSLCNGDYAKWIITDNEMRKANGDILKAIPLSLSELSEREILSPTFCEIPCDFDSEEDEPAEQFGQEEQDRDEWSPSMKKCTKSAEKNGDAADEFGRLNETKHSLDFIKRYNEGLLKPVRWNSKRGE